MNVFGSDRRNDNKKPKTIEKHVRLRTVVVVPYSLRRRVGR